MPLSSTQIGYPIDSERKQTPIGYERSRSKIGGRLRESGNYELDK